MLMGISETNNLAAKTLPAINRFAALGAGVAETWVKERKLYLSNINKAFPLRTQENDGDSLSVLIKIPS